jgi:hypothetical protein
VVLMEGEGVGEGEIFLSNFILTKECSAGNKNFQRKHCECDEFASSDRHRHRERQTQTQRETKAC